MLSRLWPALPLLLTSMTFAPLARAQATFCEPSSDLVPAPDDPVVSPPHLPGQATVPRNTLIRVDLDPSLEPQLWLVEVIPRDDGDPNDPEDDIPEMEIPVASTWQQVGETGRFVGRPLALLDADTDYRVHVNALTGVVREFDFTTSDVIDEEPPTFPFGPDRVTSYSVNACDNDDGYLVSLEIKHAEDNGSEGGIEYLLYLTRAEGISAPQLLLRQYRSTSSITFRLTEQNVATPICILIDAVDTVGLHATGVKEFCFDPLQGNYFEPCSVMSGPRAAQGFAASMWIALTLLALSVRRRRLAAPVLIAQR